MMQAGRSGAFRSGSEQTKSRSICCGIFDTIHIRIRSGIELCLYRSSYRAVSSASSAVDASALIDNVRCTLSNSLYRAVTSANSAADAVVSDLICHNITSLVITVSTTLSITLGVRVVNNKKTK